MREKQKAFTPCELLFGHTASRTPNKLYNKKDYDSTKKISDKQSQFKPGDKNYIRKSEIRVELQNKFIVSLKSSACYLGNKTKDQSKLWQVEALF